MGDYPPRAAGTVAMLAKVPAGELIDQRRHEPGRRTAEVLCSDGSWRQVSVLAWASRRGGWAVLIRWPDGTEDWREYDRRNLRLALPLGVSMAVRSHAP